MKHTQGDWVVATKGALPYQRIMCDGKIIADTYSFSEGISVKEARANTKLMAHAPKMLKAIRNMLSTLAEQLDDEYKDNESIISAFNECAEIAETLTPYKYDLQIDPDYISQRRVNEKS